MRCNYPTIVKVVAIPILLVSLARAFASDAGLKEKGVSREELKCELGLRKQFPIDELKVGDIINGNADLQRFARSLKRGTFYLISARTADQSSDRYVFTLLPIHRQRIQDTERQPLNTFDIGEPEIKLEIDMMDAHENQVKLAGKVSFAVDYDKKTYIVNSVFR